MIYVVSTPPRSGMIAELQMLMTAVETLADAFRRLSEGAITEGGEEEPMEDEEKDYVRYVSSCDLPSLPKHQIPWYTSGFQ